MELSSLPLHSFSSISLQEMDAVQLLNRTDTKYFFNETVFSGLLENLKDNYNILELKQKRASLYQTLYFDTQQLDLYLQHHNGKKNRYKVRIRKYLNSGLCFLEVKMKTNKGRTNKKRIPIADFETNLSNASLNYIADTTTMPTPDLDAALWNTFTRITLVHKTEKERLTLDFNLAFESADKKHTKELPGLVIAELKQEKFNIRSDFVKAIKKYNIRPMRISKYCTGSLLLNDGLKYNRFKKRLRMIKKTQYELAA